MRDACACITLTIGRPVINFGLTSAMYLSRNIIPVQRDTSLGILNTVQNTNRENNLSTAIQHSSVERLFFMRCIGF